jgi:hypothetical protein
MHGEYLYSTNCGEKYKVKNHDLERLKEKCVLDNDEKILTLKEMLEFTD